MDSKKHSCVFWKKWLLRDLDGRKWKTGSLARAFSCQTYFGGAHNACKMCLFIMSLLWTDYKNAEIPILFMYNKKIITINAQRYPKIKPLTECNALLLFVPFGSVRFFLVYFLVYFFPFDFYVLPRIRKWGHAHFTYNFHIEDEFSKMPHYKALERAKARARSHTLTLHTKPNHEPMKEPHTNKVISRPRKMFSHTRSGH